MKKTILLLIIVLLSSLALAQDISVQDMQFILIPDTEDIVVIKTNSPPVVFTEYIIEDVPVPPIQPAASFIPPSIEQTKEIISNDIQAEKSTILPDEGQTDFNPQPKEETGEGEEEDAQINNINVENIYSNHFRLDVGEHDATGWNYIDSDDWMTSSLYHENYAIYTQNYGLMQSRYMNQQENWVRDFVVTQTTSPATSNAGSWIGDYVDAVVQNQSIEIERYYDLPQNGTTFYVGYKIRNIGGSTLNDVRFFNMIDAAVGSAVGSYAYYNPADDTITYGDHEVYPLREKYKIMMYSNRHSTKHGVGCGNMSGTYTPYWDSKDDLFDFDLNGETECNLVDPLANEEYAGAGLQYNIGDLAPGQEEEILFTLYFANYTARYLPDLQPVNLTFQKQSNDINVSFKLQNLQNYTARGFKINYFEIKDEKIIQNKTLTYNNSFGAFDVKTISTLFNVNADSEVYVYIDADQLILETDEGNNFLRETYYSSNVYIDVNVTPLVLTDVFENYIEKNLGHYNIVDDESLADYKIIVGDSFNNYTMGNLDWGKYYGNVKMFDKQGNLPYNALINVFENDTTNIVVQGNAIEGIVAALRAFDYSELENNKEMFIGKENIAALGTFDYFSVAENRQFYMNNNKTFSDIVYVGLLGGYEFTQETVKTQDLVTLRLKHIKPQRTLGFGDFMDAIKGNLQLNYSKTPIVMAGGLWNNLSYWEDLGAELAVTGRDVWLIEITGGNNTENYDFDKMIDSYWPALIAGVQQYSGQNKIQYVGFSNGARTALSSLDRHSAGVINAGLIWNGTAWKNASMTANPIDTMVALGVPGAFEGDSLIKSAMESRGDNVINKLEQKGLNSFSFDELIKQGVFNKPYFDDDAEISLNLLKSYQNFITNTSDLQPGLNVNVSKFIAVRGYLVDSGYDSDSVVTLQDMNSIYGNVSATNKTYYKVLGPHSSMSRVPSFSQRDVAKDIVIRSLNGDYIPSLVRCYNQLDPNNKPGWCTE